MRSFPGGVFDKHLEGGRAGAAVSVVDNCIRAETHHGRVYELTAAHCEIELGGASGRMWFCRSEDRELTLYSEASGFGDALGALPPLADAVRRLRRRRRAEAGRGGMFLLGAVALLGALAVGGYYGLRSASRMAVVALPTEADERIGRLTIASMNLGGPVLREPTVTSALSATLSALSAHTSDDFRFHLQVVDAPAANAFALPGGELVVYSGLLARAESVDAVAGVLAHEMTHVTERHGIAKIAQHLGLWGALDLLLGDIGGLSTLAIELLRTGMLTQYSQEQEHAADAGAVRVMHAAGFDPSAFTALLTALHEPEAGQRADLEAATGAVRWLDSHPALPERSARIEALSQALGRPRGATPDIRWDAVRELIRAD